MFIPLHFWSRNYWSYLNHLMVQMGNIWENFSQKMTNSIMAGNLNSGLSYLITIVIYFKDDHGQREVISTYLTLHPLTRCIAERFQFWNEINWTMICQYKRNHQNGWNSWIGILLKHPPMIFVSKGSPPRLLDDTLQTIQPSLGLELQIQSEIQS